MEKKCPRCGKIVVVSAEEVAMREGVVVCPQCLAVFDMDGNVRHKAQQGTARHLEEASEQSPAPIAAEQDAFSFCHECGKPLPQGIKFCPYCGIKLGVVPAAVAADPVVVHDEPQDAPADAEPQPEPEEPKWTPVYPTYHYQEHKWGTEPASPRARLAGYSIITVLLIVLGVIVYHGWLIGGF